MSYSIRDYIVLTVEAFLSEVVQHKDAKGAAARLASPEYGFETVDDLSLAEDEDLEKMGFSLLHRRKILNYFKKARGIYLYIEVF